MKSLSNGILMFVIVVRHFASADTKKVVLIFKAKVYYRCIPTAVNLHCNNQIYDVTRKQLFLFAGAKSYFYVDQKLEFDEANTYCQTTHNGYLATIDSQQTSDYITQNIVDK